MLYKLLRTHKEDGDYEFAKHLTKHMRKPFAPNRARPRQKKVDIEPEIESESELEVEELDDDEIDVRDELVPIVERIIGLITTRQQKAAFSMLQRIPSHYSEYKVLKKKILSI
jgi:hypothetical protein